MLIDWVRLRAEARGKTGSKELKLPRGGVATKCMGYLWGGGREEEEEGGGIKRRGCSLTVISPQCLLHQRHQSQREGRSSPPVAGGSEWGEFGGGGWVTVGWCVCVWGEEGQRVHSAFLDCSQHGGCFSNHYHEDRYLKSDQRSGLSWRWSKQQLSSGGFIRVFQYFFCLIYQYLLIFWPIRNMKLQQRNARDLICQR